MTTLQNATFEYDGEVLFHDLTLELPPGEWTCLLGPSGVGKTSLLRLFAQQETLKTSIAYMAQQDMLLPWLSALDNVLIGARLRGEALQYDRALQMLDRVGLAESAHKKPNALSGGMRQRVALARTLIDDKSIILMDEPFSAVDAVTRMKLQTLAQELLQNKTVLLVTHDLFEALHLADQIFVMRGQPATLSEPIKPKTFPDSELFSLQKKILEMLC